jgi:hypothetical protein
MKTLRVKVPTLIAMFIVSGSALAEGSVRSFGQSANHIGQSASHVGQSAIHTAKASGNAVVGTTKLVAGVAAVPLKTLGAVGDVSHAAGDLLWNAATGTDRHELEVSDETITAGPAPKFAMINQ